MNKSEALSPALVKAMGNTLTRNNHTNRHCPNCHFALPIYPGAYPRFCPVCGKQIVKFRDASTILKAIDNTTGKRSEETGK